jgi:hypothetical protein
MVRIGIPAVRTPMHRAGLPQGHGLRQTGPTPVEVGRGENRRLGCRKNALLPQYGTATKYLISRRRADGCLRR